MQANKGIAQIHVLPTVALRPVSPADFSRTKQLIERGYTSTLRYLDAATAPARAHVRFERKQVGFDRSPVRAA